MVEGCGGRLWWKVVVEGCGGRLWSIDGGGGGRVGKRGFSARMMKNIKGGKD